MRPVDVLNQDSRLTLAESSVGSCVAAMDAFEGGSVPGGSLGVAFVDEQECSRLHAAFFGDPEVTDVMTFPGDPEDSHAGDIAICPVVAAAAAAESGLSFQEELTLYLVHAWLHLSGMEDASANGQSAMRGAEGRMMQMLHSRNALLKASWRP
jgi:probable rRNA maturation factor